MTLKSDGWPWKTIGTSSEQHQAICIISSSDMWIQIGVTVRKRLSWVLTSVTLTFDLWPWPLAWTLLLSMVITPENFMMIRWPEHSQKGVTDRQTDRQTDGRTERSVLRAAWSQLKMSWSVYDAMDHQVYYCYLSDHSVTTDITASIQIELWNPVRPVTHVSHVHVTSAVDRFIYEQIIEIKHQVWQHGGKPRCGTRLMATGMT